MVIFLRMVIKDKAETMQNDKKISYGSSQNYQ